MDTQRNAVSRVRTLRGALAAFVLIGLACLVGGGCSSDDVCDRACTAWAVDYCWGYDECWDECEADGDWSSAYAQCCEDHAGDCVDLEVICG